MGGQRSPRKWKEIGGFQRHEKVLGPGKMSLHSVYTKWMNVAFHKSLLKVKQLLANELELGLYAQSMANSAYRARVTDCRI